ncbi:MAG: type II toxin-antitoxin system VapC family toxin [Deltaproteobacteria bacterium]|nr:type II toxin-antitoxin system VapC family toxin [Deltaproteobacteria bacterium]MBW1928691.1 type II toxin-antitoxin system VapC family toxin [Deltaproteobacteria bacterium]MBW2027192.1 type II toxin-antitoxin system VapC family toxin [Deltaproteobacteria bacterium]MBW2127700.1 type II toxin-antitoxin system VapC family toxin [Deltaproteobacteria bacterium]
MIYWDTSAIIKLFVREPGTVRVRSLFERDHDVVISKIGFAEAHSALARRMREKIPA